MVAFFCAQQKAGISRQDSKNTEPTTRIMRISRSGYLDGSIPLRPCKGTMNTACRPTGLLCVQPEFLESLGGKLFNLLWHVLHALVRSQMDVPLVDLEVFAHRSLHRIVAGHFA
jgi:hypothetical protein